jgi:hypothetical protein
MNTYPSTLQIIDLPTDELLSLESILWNDADSDEVTKLLIFISQELKHRGV